MSVLDLAFLDDEGLRTFLDPADRGVDPLDLGAALRGSPELAARVRAALPEPARARLDEAYQRGGEPDPGAGRRVVRALFWPLVYWTDPDGYAELVAGEPISPRLLELIDVAGREVCDIGAGDGRFTLHAARTAKRVIAVDAVPPLLERLRGRAIVAGADNVEIRRGSFQRLPLDDASVDVAVACSAFHSRGPHGGERALAEAERIVRPGGEVAVIWPVDEAWLRRHGFTVITVEGPRGLRFRDVATAERVCADFYSARAAEWVRAHRTAEVPAEVLGVATSDVAGIKRIV